MLLPASKPDVRGPANWSVFCEKNFLMSFSSERNRVLYLSIYFWDFTRPRTSGLEAGNFTGKNIILTTDKGVLQTEKFLKER